VHGCMVEMHLNKMFKYDQKSREYLHSTSGAPPTVSPDK
jgi:hypothetical protein